MKDIFWSATACRRFVTPLLDDYSVAFGYGKPSFQGPL